MLLDIQKVAIFVLIKKQIIKLNQIVNMKTDLGNLLRKLRLLKGFSQEYVALQLNVSTNAYGKIERGQTDVGITKLLKMLEVLEIDPCDFFNLLKEENITDVKFSKDNQNQSEKNHNDKINLKSLIEKVNQHEHSIFEIYKRLNKLENREISDYK